MTQGSLREARRPAPPYGPAEGMMQGLQLLQRSSPPTVDVTYLKANRVAPGNEYKVVGALKFLGLLDNEGRPTESSRLLKTRGPTFTSALQSIVKKAYERLFRQVEPREATRERIYNYFVTEAGLGTEMAAKATRFLIGLCRLAEIELGSTSAGAREAEASPTMARSSARGRSPRPRASPATPSQPPYPLTTTFPLVFAITPETAEMDVEQLTELFRKMKVALERSFSER